jgi:hypothetical protein
MPVTRTTFANIGPTDWTNRPKPKPKQPRADWPCRRRRTNGLDIQPLLATANAPEALFCDSEPHLGPAIRGPVASGQGEVARCSWFSPWQSNARLTDADPF